MRNKVGSMLSAVVISFLIACGGISCMATAFPFSVVSIAVLVLFCLLFSVLTAVITGTKHGIWVLLGSAVFVLGIICREPVIRSFRSLLFQITDIYNKAYGTGVFGEGQSFLRDYSLNWSLCLIAAVVSTTVCLTVNKRVTAILAVAVGILPLGSCLVVTDMVPSGWAIFLLLSGLVLLILTQSVRRRDEIDGNRLTAMLLIPACLMTALLFWAIPRDGYEIQSGRLEEKILSLLQKLPFVPDGSTQAPGPDGNILGNVEVKLDKIGPNIQPKYRIMDVVSPQGGLLYLRDQAYDIYTGKAWQVTAELTDDHLGWPTGDMQKLGMLQISTRGAYSFKFIPYYISGSEWLDNYAEGSLKNGNLSRNYTFELSVFPEKPALRGQSLLPAALQEHYTQLPEATKRKAKALLSGVDASLEALTVEDKAQAIAQYVSQCASYDLMTEKMPDTESDFAIWFLEQGQTGYCVHYASAAVVLLRAAGVPARYVTGYLANVDADMPYRVTANQAHAWVEYCDPTMGWRCLEPTPAEGQPEPPAVTEPSQTVTTRPDDDPTQTQPTEPDGTDEPGTTAGNGDGSQGEGPDRTWLWKALKVLAQTAGAAAVLWLQFWARRRWRHRKMHTGHLNKQCLARWREVLRFCRILKESPPEELEALAEKAKFSQHKLTPEERKSFDHWLRRAKKRLCGKPLALLYRLIWAV